MAYSFSSLILQRVVIPIVLVTAALYRPVGISFVYLLMFFVSPFIPVAKQSNFKGSVTAFLVIIIAQTSLLILCHGALQLVILFLKLDDIFGNCSFTERLLRHIGFVDFKNLNAVAVIEWLIPEVVVFLASLVVYLIIKSIVFTNRPGPNELENGEADAGSSQPYVSDQSGVYEIVHQRKHSFLPVNPNFEKLIKISPLFCIASLFFAAVLRPSVPGGLYFLIFLIVGTYWATMKPLRRGFSILLRAIMIILVLHILCVVAYQTPWMQQHLDKNNRIARLIGLEPLVNSSCDGNNDIRIIIYDTTNYDVASYLNPLVLCISFYVLAVSAKNLSKPAITKTANVLGQQLENGSSKFSQQFSRVTQKARSSKKDSWTKRPSTNVSLRRELEQRPMITEPSETTPLVPSAQKNIASVEAYGDKNDIPMSSTAMSSGTAEPANREAQQETRPPTPSLIDQLCYGFISIGGFIYQNSYIFTNILMMAWSIVYHSWLTFVFLLWANTLWMIPNQRKAMMRSSPFIVLYAEFLLIAQYVYGMNLTPEELPDKVDMTGINLAQIGFIRPKTPCIPLFVKTSFLLMFWITLRQYLSEKKDIRQSERFPLFTPLQFSKGSTSAATNQKRTSMVLKKVGEIFKSLLVRLWIWLLVLIIFLCAIAGKDMTGFRIFYMALFLFFLLVFQVSSKAWIKIMYGFWLCLICYVMTILILIYTYQFDKFDQYWNDYMNIPKKLQADIGLERYETKDLFLNLLAPTLIVILTVIQVHYFHKRFIEALHQNTSETVRQPKQSNRYTENLTDSSKEMFCKEPVTDLIKIFVKRARRRLIWIFKNTKNVFWRILELHILKLVYLTAFVCCVNEVCILHLIFLVLCVLGVCSNQTFSVFISRLIALVVSLIIITKMVYQVAYLDHAIYNVNCTSSSYIVKNLTVNDAEWFGLRKAPAEKGGLMTLLKLYIVYMVVLTLHAVVNLRQSQMRSQPGAGSQKSSVLFPKITRIDAEKNLNKMVKYLLNYGFYKFGWEITMIWLASTITYRQDIVAIPYSVWLAILMTLKRPQVARIWVVFLWFVLASIVAQYVLLIGLPPSLCLVYPWEDTEYNEATQRWAMLPGNLGLNHVTKLIFDFVLLMFITSQWRAFKIITPKNPQDNATPYPGGTNRSVVKDIAKLGQEPFVNPTRDFLSNVRNYLDIFLNVVFSGFYWLTLAVVFFGGTNIHNFLAIGYLVGAFIFLWEGSDFYLRPIDSILKRWKWLIAYNVGNILIKTVLQIGGCMFLGPLRTYCCWLIHIFGITCAARPHLDDGPKDTLIDCPEAKKEAVILWDAICFGFLIFQLRIFRSHYFCHMILDTRANNILASRGAEIIEDLRQKQIEHRQEHEREVLLKIKRKMEKIRATQQKMLRPIDKPTHFDAKKIFGTFKIAPSARQSYLSSYQATGYHTPNDDETASCTESHSSHSDRDGLEQQDEGRLLSEAEAGLAVKSPHEIRIEYADAASSDTQTDYGDVRSVSELDVDHALLLNAPVHLELPEMASMTSSQQQLTPNSDLLTLPFDGYFETNRQSTGSVGNSDILAMPLREDTETETGSSNVFAPTAYNTIKPSTMHTLTAPTNTAATSCSLNVNASRGSSLLSSNVTSGIPSRHRRQSSINAVSWNERVSIKCTPKESYGSGDVHTCIYQEHENICALKNKSVAISEDAQVTLRQKSLHRRHLSVGNATYSMDDAKAIEERRRRSSNVSWARNENIIRAATRPKSWGPVEDGNPVPASRPHKRREPRLHGEAVRAGDYYMFEDMDDKFELDIIDAGKDFLEEQEQLSESEKKMTLRKTLFQVWKDLTRADNRRQSYLRQRSCASVPGSRFDFGRIDSENFAIDVDTSESFDDYTNADVSGGIRISTHSEPPALKHSKSEHFVWGKPVSVPSKLKDDKEDIEDKGDKEEKEGKEEKEIGGAPVEETDRPVEHAKSDQSKVSTADKRSKKETTEDDELEANPIARLVEGFLVSMTIRLNRFSRNYRYVNKILAEEKRILKESETLNRISRPGAASMFNVFRTAVESNINETTPDTITQLTAITPTETDLQSPMQSDSVQEMQHPNSQQLEQIAHADHDIIEIPLDTVDARIDKGSKTSVRKSVGPYAIDDSEFAARDHHIIVEVAISLWYALLSNTDLFCYMVIFISQISNPSILSLPLPLMVFLWGTLSLPRPTKTFWVTLITYTQAIVLIKCIFQYKLIWANYTNVDNEPLSWEKVLGVEESDSYAYFDLVVLLILFFHRYILKSHGLWKSKNSFSDENIVSDQENVTDVYKSDDFITAEEGEEWKDAESNAEVRHNQSAKKDDEEPANERRKEGGVDRISKSSSLERIRGQIGDQLSQKSNEESDKYTEGLRQLRRAKYLSSTRKFFYNLVHRPRLPDDVYALMFLCDFINFFVLLFGFASFSSRQTEEYTGGLQTYLMENKVPIPFLIMLLVQFLLIVIDRALYLRKALVQKIVFHFLSVVGVHIWMFFIVPFVTERSFYHLVAPIIFYIFKCFYMLLSSYQIKCGYPRRILGNFLTKGFSIANMIAFKVFTWIPFLYELRTILDWLCTSTTMTMFDWLKMEDIFSEIFFIRCTRQLEQDFPAMRSQKKQLFGKLILGGTIILVIVILIWGPLCLFALSKTVGESNIPTAASVTIRIGPYDPLYVSDNRESIQAFSASMYQNMTNAYSKNRDAIGFLSGYDYSDVAAIKLAGSSPSLWAISPPDKNRLLNDLIANKTLTARFIYSLTRQGPRGVAQTVSSEIKVPLKANFNERQQLIDMIGGKTINGTIKIPEFLPKFLQVLNSGDASVVTELMPSEVETYRPLILGMYSTGPEITWWEIRDDCSDKSYEDTLKDLPFDSCNSGVIIYTFNDKKFPESLGVLAGAGILGMYTTFVLVASRLLKGSLTNQHQKIMFHDLPYVDRMLQLCLDIYLVREALEFTLEEDLFAKLIFLYRSPETLIKWTRPREDSNDDETDSESARSRSSGSRQVAEQ